MAAFFAARELGADGVEFDVHLTSDGIPVVLHDYDLARTTSSSGYVFETTVDCVRSLDAGSWFHPRFAGERVPLLEEVLAMEDIDFELEVKGVPSQRLVEAIVGEVRNAGVEDRLELTGSHFVVMQRLRRELAEVQLGLFPQTFTNWMTMHLYEEIVIETARTGNYNVVHVPSSILVLLERDRFVEADLRLHAADPASREEMTIALDKADQFTTGDVAEAVQRRRDVQGT